MFTTSFRDTTLASLAANGTHIGLITAVTDMRAGTVTASTYTGYARVAVSWGAASDTSPAGGRQRSNSAAVTFPQNTGVDHAVIGWGVYTDLAAGTLLDIGFIDADSPVVGTLLAGTDIITAYGHGLSTDQRVFVVAAPMGAAPDALAENTAYYVLAAGLTADVFALSASSGGGAVNSTTSGVAWFIPYTSQTIAANSTPEFATGALVVQI